MSRESLVKLIDSKTSVEEGDAIDYDYFIEDDKVKAQPRKHEYYYQDYPYVRPTQSDFDNREIKDSKLFDCTKKIKSDDSEDDTPGRDASILVTGFGMRNVSSFQRLLKMSQEERKKWQLRKLWRDEQKRKSLEEREKAMHSARTDTTDLSTITESKSKTSSDLITQTETMVDDKVDGAREEMKHLDYLLGIETEIEEDQQSFEIFEKITEASDDDFKYSSSKSIREAQRYLRAHRIFECFQFIVAHLLSANAQNPVEFILNLLNRCLLYRSGFGEAPLLYQNKHITKLFDLMDRMQSGFIDLNQYTTGMKTLGICSYNEDPEVNDDDLVSKETFVEEAYEAELAIFIDMIKKRPEKHKLKQKKTPAALGSVSVPSLSPPYFIPSDLFKFSKASIGMDILQQDMGGGE